MSAGVAGERIVLVDRDGCAVGTAPKAASHHRETPLHLAFSCYLVDERGRLLVTRRAAGKPTFPSVWTNSCCGHPAPGESLRAAVRRRVRTELGAGIGEPTLVLPRFAYRAVMANGVVEHELCPVVRAVPLAVPEPDPTEVGDLAWYDWPACVELSRAPDAAPWFTEQVARLAPLGPPARWPAADPALLPPALPW